MMTRSFLGRASLLAVALLAALPLVVYAGSPAPTPVTMNIFHSVVDEQDLNAFYHVTGSCSGTPPVVDLLAGFGGDSIHFGPNSAYGFGSPWELVSNLVSTTYVHGADCNPSTQVCLGVKLNHNEKTLSLDTRGTLGPRKVAIDFSKPCYGCAVPGNSDVFAAKPLPTTMLISVFMDNPFTSMAVCSSRACPEAQPSFVKLWFDDPGGDPLLTWRIDWANARVLRMSANTWYVIANGCDGFQVAGLNRLHNSKKRPTASFRGSYLMPLFLSVVK